MNVIENYGKIIKKSMNIPKNSLNLIKLGLFLEKFRLSKFQNKSIPRSLNYLNKICIQFILEPLIHPDFSAFVNLFAPTEILHAMGIYPSFIEGFSSFLSGFTCEDYFIDYAHNIGICETLCSYHKVFIGAIASNLIPRPKFAITTSMICDANINTFRYTAQKYNIPLYIIDIPYKYNKDTQIYVANQIKEMIKMIEDVTGKKFDETKLKEIIKLENKSRKLNKDFFHLLKNTYFPNTLTFEMYKIFLSHVAMGRYETYKFYKMQLEDIKHYPHNFSKRFLWIHLLPFYNKTLKSYFNLNTKYQLLSCDLNFDYTDELDYNHPYESLAKKMILNQYNGAFRTKATNIAKMCDFLNVDGVINFCHWGCKQSSGGTGILKETLYKKGIPFLSIDGDGVDRKSAFEGQIKTRIEAFLEIVEAQKKKVI